MPIVRDDDVLSGDPRIEGTRIGVHHVYELVVAGDHDPEDAADQLDIELAAVYEALAYYYDNPGEMRAVRRRHAEVERELTETALQPPRRAQ